jgi:hypothetical protein
MTALRVWIGILFGALPLFAQSASLDLGQTMSAIKMQPYRSYLSAPLILPSADGVKEPVSSILLLPQAAASAAQTTPQRPRAVTYSQGYEVRAKIHKYASIATVPLFAAEAIVGQKLYDDSDSESDSLRSAHSGLAAGMGVLFGLNTVTGVWNMWEDRKNPSGHKKKWIHSILMLAADAGFLATAALAPGEDDGDEHESGGSASTHRAVAYGSMGVATAGYVYMLLAK